MHYWAVEDGERLIATIRRTGNGKQSPVRWLLVWSLAEESRHKTPGQVFDCRHAALALALAQSILA